MPNGRPGWTMPWMLWPLLAVVGLLFLRRPDVFVNPQFWAEDSVILFLGARTLGWATLFTPYPGYYILAQRFVACAAKDLPAVIQPWVYCYSSVAFLLLTAWFCLRARVDYLMDRRGRIALALSLVLVPQSGEILMSLIGSQWTLMPILFILIIQDRPARPAQGVADFLGLLLSGLTGPFVVLSAPFFLVRLRRVTGGWCPYNLALIGTAWGLALRQWLTIQSKPLPPTPVALDPSLWLQQLGLALPGGLFFGASAPNWMGRLFLVISPALLALLGWALWRGEKKRSWAVLALLGCGGMSYVGGIRVLGLDAEGSLSPFGPGARYYYPFYLAAFWAGIIFYHDASTHLRRAATAAVVMMLLSSASHYTIAGNPDYRWRKYARRLDAGREVKGIPVLPDWKMNVPARR